MKLCYSRACAQYSDFLDKSQVLYQDYVAPRWKSALQQFYLPPPRSGVPLRNIHFSNDN